jgi:hypothetical protein
VTARADALAAVDALESAAEHWAGDTLRAEAALVRDALTPPLPADLAAIQARADAAGDEVDRLTTGNPGTNWRWSIPANPERDSDLILAASIADVPALVAELAELRAQPRLTAEMAETILEAGLRESRLFRDEDEITAAVNALRAIAEQATR